jgi:predicted acylesterase/phospholipase RssA
MKKIGLALSGGGFRASLYHLGVVRFLRDAGILSQVTHITSVSGGSVLGAHLALNWDRYNGSPDEFDAVANELLAFIRMDIRNRITRRFPLTLPLRWARWLVGRSNRKLTRTGLLEYHYEKYLFGDVSLFELPERPRLHVLATNLSEGCLCSFTRDGLLMVRGGPGGLYHLERVAMGLATVAMAVTASSAFPGFFPPLELTGTDVGSGDGEFGRHAYTDGGVYDNLGVRMFRCLERSRETGCPVARANFVNIDGGLDIVLVSDVGKRIEVQGARRPGGLIRTAIRATDILMDRVWQLEKENFQDSAGFVFAPIKEVVDPSEDPTAPHPEVQRQVANIRTDLDRFSPLEISALARHGYCVARKSCRANPALFGADLPNDPPWDPVPAPPAPPPVGPVRGPAPTTAEARTLQGSAFRRIWGTLLDYRDWASYVYVPLIVPILVGLPYFVAKSYQRSARAHRLMHSLSQGSRDLEKMSFLLENDPAPWAGEGAEEAPAPCEPSFKGFEILQDSRIIDLRDWRPGKGGPDAPDGLIFAYRRLKVFKLPEPVGDGVFRVPMLPTSPRTAVRFPPQQIKPALRRWNIDGSAADRPEWHWEASFDFRDVPAGDNVDLLVEYHSPAPSVQRGENCTALPLSVRAETAEMTTWVLMPEGKEYHSFRITRHETGNFDKVEAVKVVTEYLSDDSSIIAFKLLSLKPGYTYDVSWSYK